MNVYEILDGETVLNTVVADAEFMAANYPEFRLVGAVEEPARPRHITQFAFRQRMTQAERIAIEFASLDDPSASMAVRQQAAALRVGMGDLAQAQYVDLDHPEVVAALSMLEAAGLIAEGRAEEIRGAPVAEAERP